MIFGMNVAALKPSFGSCARGEFSVFSPLIRQFQRVFLLDVLVDAEGSKPVFWPGGT